MANFGIPKAILQLSAIASILAGIFMIAGFALHPAGEDATFGTDPRWVPAHALLWIAYTIALVGWVGVYDGSVCILFRRRRRENWGQRASWSS